MLWFSQLPGSGWAVCLLLAGQLAAQSPVETPASPPDAGPQPTRSATAASPANAGADAPGQAVQVATSDLSSLNRLLPIGKTARKVTVPTVDEDGRLTSVVTMGAITRIDEDNFELEKVVLTSFDHPDPAAPDATPDQTVITLVNARYHAPTRVLVSDQPVTIRKPTLFMTGDSLRYDSAAGRALMKGNTRALITDAPRLDTAVEESSGPDEPGDEEIDAEATDIKQGNPQPQPIPTRQ